MNYQQAINATPVALVEFYASWCPHCQRMMPVVEQIRELLGNSVSITQLDIDENTQLAEENNVNSIPTFIVYRNGREVWRHTGEIDGNLLLSQLQ